ncbi:MAG TPA: glutathione peroxidase [Pseudacidobacterium sp.]|nr:glutathione peroxidase [Pseudacidobacterium sp.]
MSTPIQNIPVRRINGEETTLAEFAGKVVLVVNVASKCGLTPQYAGLENLYRKYRERGFVVAGFPSNDFAGQEPGTNEEIQQFCSLNYNVDFPLFEKITVVGAAKHPLYQALIEARPKARSTAIVPFAQDLMKYGIQPNPEPEILWNFEKFVIGRSGEVVARFSPDTKPDDTGLTSVIEKELAKPA